VVAVVVVAEVEVVLAAAVDLIILAEVTTEVMLADMEVDQVVMETTLGLETLAVVAEVMVVSRLLL